MMLLLQDKKQIVLELPGFVVDAAPGHGYCFSLTGGGALFDEMLDVVVVDVVYSWVVVLVVAELGGSHAIAADGGRTG